MSVAVAHLVGPCITAHGRYRRQRCSWCGIALIEDDLALIMTAPGCEGGPGQWAPSTWVEVEEGNPRRTSSLVGFEDSMPENSCMAVETDLASIDHGT